MLSLSLESAAASAEAVSAAGSFSIGSTMSHTVVPLDVLSLPTLILNIVVAVIIGIAFEMLALHEVHAGHG